MAAERSTEVVPGMAEAIAQRMFELKLRPGRFAHLAGLTLQGLDPVRKGYRRQYQDKLKVGVASALQWPEDAIDRLLAGQAPSTWPQEPDPTPPEPVLQIAALAGRMTPEQRAKVEGYMQALLDQHDET